jgi:cytochrome c oxidase subunit 4
MAHGHGHASGEFAHPAPLWMLFAVFFALIGLTVLTVVQAEIETGNMEVWLSLFIATIKASLVMLFFMHLWWDKAFNKIVFLGSFIFVALFLGFTLMDREHYQERLELQTPPTQQK